MNRFQALLSTSNFRGPYTLELLALIFAHVFVTGHAGIRERLLVQLEMLSERKSLGDGGDRGRGDVEEEGEEEEEGGAALELRAVRGVLTTHAENIGAGPYTSRPRFSSP